MKESVGIRQDKKIFKLANVIRYLVFIFVFFVCNVFFVDVSKVNADTIDTNYDRENGILTFGDPAVDGYPDFLMRGATNLHIAFCAVSESQELCAEKAVEVDLDSIIDDFVGTYALVLYDDESETIGKIYHFVMETSADGEDPILSSSDFYTVSELRQLLPTTPEGEPIGPSTFTGNRAYNLYVKFSSPDGQDVYEGYIRYVNGLVCVSDDECYGNVEEALDEIPNSSSVWLIEDLDECIVIPVWAILTIDTRGKNIICNGGDNSQAINNSGKLIINNTALTDSSIEGDGLYVIRNEERATSLEINDLITISGTRTLGATCIFNASTFAITVGASIDCTKGIENDGGEITMGGAVVDAEVGLENSGEGIVDIIDSSFWTNGMAIDNTESGLINISGYTEISPEEYISVTDYVISNSSSSTINIIGSSAYKILINYMWDEAHQISIYNEGTLSMSYVDIRGSCTGLYNVGTATLGNVSITSSGRCNNSGTDVSQGEVSVYNTGNITISGSAILGSCTGIYNRSGSSVAKLILDGSSFTSSGACLGYSVGVWSGKDNDSTNVSEVEISNSNISVTGSASGKEYYGVSIGYTKLTINGGAISGSTVGVYQYAIELNYRINVNSATISSDRGCGIQSRGALYVNSGTVTGATYGISSSLRNVNIGVNSDNISWESPLVSGGVYGVYLSGGTLNFYNGTIRGVTGHFYGTMNKESSYAVRYDGTVPEGTTTYKYTRYGVAEVGEFHYKTISEAVSSITTSGTVKVMVNRTENIDIAARKEITLNLNSKEITGYIRNRGTLIINSNGKITCSTGSAITNYTSGVLEINRATITGSTYGIYANADSKITIGQNTTALSFDNPLISGGTYGIYFYSSASEFNFYNGKIRGTAMAYEDVYLSKHSSYGDIVDMEEVINGKTYYAKVNAAAKVEDNYFPTIKDAVEFVETVGTIKVLGNRIWDGIGYYVTVPFGKDIALDMNGKEIRLTMRGAAAIQVFTNNGTLTIYGNGTIIGGSTGMPTINNSGTLSVLNGTIKNTGNPAISSTGGTITIGQNAGNISWDSPLIVNANATAYAINYNNTILNFYNGMIKSGKVPTTEEYYAINGTITGKLDYSKIVNVEEENSITYYGIVYAIVESEGRYYRTIQEAINAAPTYLGNVDCENSSSTGTRITVLRNTNECLIVPSDKAIILNLNGYTVSCLSNSNALNNSGVTTVRDGTMKTKEYVYSTAISNSGILNTISLNVNGGTILSNSSNGCAVIDGGRYYSGSATGISNSGKLIVKRGVVEVIESLGTQAIYSSGTLIIGENKNELSWTDPLIKSKGYGINVTGGTFNFYNGMVMGTTAPGSGQKNGISGVVSAVSTYGILFNGSSVIENGVTYYPSMIAAARVGNVYYRSIQEAIDGVAETDTVVVLSYREDVFTIPSDKNILLDMNGKEVYTTVGITGGYNNASVVNNGSLTIFGNGKLTNDTMYAYVLGNTGSLTITDGEINGSIKTTSGSITMNGGSIFGSGYGIYSQNTSIVINSGSVSSTGYGVYVQSNSGVVIGRDDVPLSWESPLVSGGSYGVYINNGAGTLDFYNGKIRGTAESSQSNPRYGVYGSIRHKSSRAEMILDEETINGTKYYFRAYAIVKDSNGNYYFSVQDAINSISGTGTMEMMSDINECLYINNTLNITILMNGKTIQCDSVDIPTIKNEGVLTILQTGTIKATQYYGIITSNKLVVNDVTINGDEGAIKNDVNGLVEINSGNITGSVVGVENTGSNENAIKIAGGTISESGDGNTAIINSSGGGVVVTGSAVIDGDFISSSTGAFSMDKGTINGCVTVSATSEVSGGLINAGVINSGTLTVSGGIINGSSSNSGTLIVNGGEFVDEGGEFVDEIKAIDNSGTLTINGGTITGSSSNSGTLIVNGDEFVDEIKAIGNSGTLTINGGLIRAIGDDEGVESYGVYNEEGGSVTLSKNVKNVVGGPKTGIYNMGSLTLSEGSAIGTITVGEETIPSSIAIYNKGTLNVLSMSIIGSAIGIINEGEMNNINYLTVSATDIAIKNIGNGEVTMLSGTLTATNYALYNESNKEISFAYTGLHATGEESNAVFSNSGTVTLNYLTIQSPNVGVYNDSGSTMYIKGAETSIKTTESYAMKTAILNKGTLNFEADTKNVDGLLHDFINHGIANISAGTIIWVENNAETTTISGGAITMLDNNGGKTILSGGSINNVFVTLGEFELNGGIINNDITNYAVTTVIKGNIGGNATNNAEGNFYMSDGKISNMLTNFGISKITGGTISDITVDGGQVETSGIIQGDISVNDGEARILGGEIQGETSNKSTLYIEGGLVCYLSNDGDVTMSGGTVLGITNLTGNVELNGGTAVGNIENLGLLDVGGDAVVEGEIRNNDSLNIRGGTVYKVVNLEGSTSVSGGSGEEFENTVELNVSGGSISVLTTTGDVSMTGGSIGDATIDQTKLTMSGGIITDSLVNDGEVTIQGGIVAACVTNKFVITMDSGSIYCITNIGTVNVEGGTVGSVTVEEITSNAEQAIINRNTGVVNVSDGVIIATKYGIYNESSNSSPVNISGGNVSTSSTDSTSAGVYNISETIRVSGSAVIGTETTNAIYNLANIDISGGTVTTIVNGYVINEDDEVEEGIVIVSGGTVSNIINDGNVVVSGGTVSNIINDGNVVVSGGTVSNIENKASLEINGELAAVENLINNEGTNHDSIATLELGTIGIATINAGQFIMNAGTITKVTNYSDFDKTGGNVTGELINESGITKISGGVVTTASVKGGELEITAGSIGTLTNYALTNIKEGAEIAEKVTNHHTLNINGGTIAALENKDVVGNEGESITTISESSIENVVLTGGKIVLTSGQIIEGVRVDGGIFNVNNGIVAPVEINDGTVNVDDGEIDSVTVNGGVINISGGTIENGLVNKGTTNVKGGIVRGTIGITNDGNGVVNASGGQIIGSDIGINNISDSDTDNVIIKDGVSISGQTGVKNSGALNISGGIITGSNYGVHNVLANEESKEPALTITGGEISATGESGGVYAIYNASGVVQIGEDDGSVSVSVPKLSSNGDVALYKEAGELSFFDGVLYGKVYTCAKLDDDGNVFYGCNESIDGVPNGYGVRTRDYLSEGIVYNKESFLIEAAAIVLSPAPIEVFKTLQAAIDWISGEGEIQIVSNFQECVTINNGQTITLSMNGKTISCAEEDAPTIDNKGILTIKQSGTIESSQYYAIITSNDLTVKDVIINGDNGAIKNSGTVEINSGEITGAVMGIENVSGSVTINGGIVKVIEGGTNAINNAGTVSISGEAVVTGTGVTVINNLEGGTLNIEGGTIGSHGEIIANTAISNYGNLSITGGTIDSLEYAILEYAIYENKMSTISGGEISSIYISENATSVVVSGSAVISSIANSSHLEINGGAIESVISGAELKINGGTIENISIISGTFEMLNGTISGDISNSGNASISGGKVSGTLTNNLTMEISRGEINKIINNGTVTVNGGEINSITNEASTITINNGEIVNLINNNKEVTNEGIEEIIDGTVTINGGFITAGAINNSNMTVLGGTITNQGNAIVNNVDGTLILGEDDDVISNNPIIESANGYAVTSVGEFKYFDGTLKGSTANEYTYQITDEELFENDTFGEYTEIIESQYVTKLLKNAVKINRTNASYNTLSQAITASIANDVITVLTDITEFALEIPEGAIITLDLNGHILNNYIRDRKNSEGSYSFITVNGELSVVEPTNAQVVNMIETHNILTAGIENNGRFTLGTAVNEINTSSLIIKSYKESLISNPGYIFTYNNGVMKSLISNVFNCQNKDLYIRSQSIVVFNKTDDIYTSSLQIGEILGSLSYDSYVEGRYDENDKEIKDLTVMLEHEVNVTSSNEKIEVYFRTKEPGELLISCSTSGTISQCTMEDYGDKAAYLYNAIYEHELLVKYSNYDDSGNILSMQIARERLLIRHDVDPGLVADVVVPAGSGYELRSDGQILLISLYTSGLVDLNIDELKTILFGDHWTTIVDSLSINTIEATTGICDNNYLGCVEIYEMEATIGEITFKEGYRAFSTGTSLGFNTLIYNYSPKLAAEVQAVNTCELGEECIVNALSFKDHTGEDITDVETIITLDGKVVEKIDTTKLGNYVVTNIATDKYGNVSGKVERTYSVVDTVAPVLKVSNQALVVSKGGVIEDLDDIIAYDNYDNIVMVERITDEVDLNKAGTYRMSYRAIDSSGNITIVYRDVIVQEDKENNYKKPLIVVGISSIVALMGSAGAVVVIKKKKEE